MSLRPGVAVEGRGQAAHETRGRILAAALAMRALKFVVRHPAVIVLPLFVLWGATHLDGFSWDYDEGVHVMDAWLAQIGHPLYAQTVSPYTPGYLLTLIAAFDLLGATMTTARLTTVLYAALGLGAVMLAARILAEDTQRMHRLGQVAPVAATALLVITPFFVQWSRAAMSDLPSEAVATLGVALGMLYLRDKQLRWLFAATFIIACALWIKAMALGGAAAIGLAALLVWMDRRRDISRAVVGIILIGFVCALPLLGFDLQGMYAQAVFFHIEKRTAYPLSLDANAAILLDFLAHNLTLTALAAYGLLRALTASHSRGQAVVVIVWFAATLLSLLFQTPIFANHHPVILVFALAAAGGCGVAWLMDDARALFARRRSFISLAGAAVLVMACLGALQYPEQLSAAASPLAQPSAEEAVALLQAVTPPEDLLVTDGQVIAFRARRQPPPKLADTSTARLASGNLTGGQLIQITQQSGANGILFWGGRIESATQFASWAAQNYGLVRSSFQRPNAPYRLLLREPHPQTPLRAQFGKGITLFGYDLNRRTGQAVQAGAPISLTLYFQRTAPVDAAYTIFTHMLDSGGVLLAQDDRPPLNGRYPTDQWKGDEYIIDEFALTVPTELRATTVQIEFGMYERETLQRAPVTVNGVRQADERVLLPPMQVNR